LKKSEMGCFLSHLSLWKLILASGQPGVVLEDDAMLGHHWVADIQALSQLQDVDYVCLETWKNKILSSERTAGHLKLRRLHLNSAGAAGYMLWPSGAARLVAQYEAIGPGLADGFINNIDDWRAWQLVPANVIQLCVAPLYGMVPPEDPRSLISNAATPLTTRPDFGLQVRMKWRRVLGELRKAKINLSVFAGRSRTHVPFQTQPFQGE
jgi:glycosyl transferase family 25